MCAADRPRVGHQLYLQASDNQLKHSSLHQVEESLADPNFKKQGSGIGEGFKSPAKSEHIEERSVDSLPEKDVVENLTKITSSPAKSEHRKERNAEVILKEALRENFTDITGTRAAKEAGIAAGQSQIDDKEQQHQRHDHVMSAAYFDINDIVEAKAVLVLRRQESKDSPKVCENLWVGSTLRVLERGNLDMNRLRVLVMSIPVDDRDGRKERRYGWVNVVGEKGENCGKPLLEKLPGEGKRDEGQAKKDVAAARIASVAGDSTPSSIPVGSSGPARFSPSRQAARRETSRVVVREAAGTMTANGQDTVESQISAAELSALRAKSAQDELHKALERCGNGVTQNGKKWSCRCFVACVLNALRIDRSSRIQSMMYGAMPRFHVARSDQAEFAGCKSYHVPSIHMGSMWGRKFDFYSSSATQVSVCATGWHSDFLMWIVVYEAVKGFYELFLANSDHTGAWSYKDIGRVELSKLDDGTTPTQQKFRASAPYDTDGVTPRPLYTPGDVHCQVFDIPGV